MKLYCCQTDIVWEDREANFGRVKALLARAKLPQGSLAALPELFATGFTMNVGPLAEGKESATTAFLAQCAREFGLYLLGGMIGAGPDGRGWNQSVLMSPAGKELARYTKIQPFTLGGESDSYEAGKQVVTLEVEGFVLAPFICYDLRFPEIFRQAAGRGAEVMVVIANWPVKRIGHWVTLLQARAIENQCYVAGVNRCGTDPTLTYNGRSLIVGPSGEILAEAGDQEQIIGAELDLAALRSLRQGLPFLKDMRKDYHQLS